MGAGPGDNAPAGNGGGDNATSAGSQLDVDDVGRGSGSVTATRHAGGGFEKQAPNTVRG